MKAYVITATCDNGYVQKLYVDARLGRLWAETQAGLLDGSSPMYLIDPRQNAESIIGKCGICQAQIHCVASDDPVELATGAAANDA